MTTQNENPVPWGHIIGAIGLILILIALNCSKSFGQSTFNYRDYQVGNFQVKVESDSIHVFESFVYEERGYKRLHQNTFSEAIQLISKGIMYYDVYTEHNKYKLFYCNPSDLSQGVCDVYVHPIIGETIHYLNK